MIFVATNRGFMKVAYLLIWGSMVVFGASAVWARVWAIRNGEIHDLGAGAGSIFVSVPRSARGAQQNGCPPNGDFCNCRQTYIRPRCIAFRTALNLSRVPSFSLMRCR
jgi:hypothetical protein